MVRFSAAGQVVEARRILSGTRRELRRRADAVGHVAVVRGARRPARSGSATPPASPPRSPGRPWAASSTRRPRSIPSASTSTSPRTNPTAASTGSSPTDVGRTSSAGTLQVMTEVGGVLGWANVPDPDGSPTPCRDQVATMKVFNGGEGAWYDSGKVYFTTKGDNRVWTYDPAANTLTVHLRRQHLADARAHRRRQRHRGRARRRLRGRGRRQHGARHPQPRGRRRAVPPAERVAAPSSPARPSAPTASRLYFSSQRNPGRTYEITRPVPHHRRRRRPRPRDLHDDDVHQLADDDAPPRQRRSRSPRPSGEPRTQALRRPAWSGATAAQRRGSAQRRA